MKDTRLAFNRDRIFGAWKLIYGSVLKLHFVRFLDAFLNCCELLDEGDKAYQRTLTIGEMINLLPVSSFTGLLYTNYYIFSCLVESNPAKLETSPSVMLLPSLSVPCLINFNRTKHYSF